MHCLYIILHTGIIIFFKPGPEPRLWAFSCCKPSPSLIQARWWARLGRAQMGWAWVGFGLWARPSTSLQVRPSYHFAHLHTDRPNFRHQRGQHLGYSMALFRLTLLGCLVWFHHFGPATILPTYIRIDQISGTSVVSTSATHWLYFASLCSAAWSDSITSAQLPFLPTYIRIGRISGTSVVSTSATHWLYFSVVTDLSKLNWLTRVLTGQTVNQFNFRKTVGQWGPFGVYCAQ
jgi:hypothetical protein